MCSIVCATSIAACGGGGEETEGTIPPATGEAIVTKLEEVRTQFEAGECDSAEATAAVIQNAIANLGSDGDIEGELEQALVEASGNLVKLTREDCQEPPDTGATGEEGAQEVEG